MSDTTKLRLLAVVGVLNLCAGGANLLLAHGWLAALNSGAGALCLGLYIVRLPSRRPPPGA